MKKYFILLITAFLFPSIVLASFNRPLGYRSSGSDVAQLQELLLSENCLSAQPTGYFGLLTLAAVKCFQVKYTISPTGYFGVLSQTQANLIINALSTTEVSIPLETQQKTDTNTSPLVQPQETCRNGYTYASSTGCTFSAQSQTIVSTSSQTQQAQTNCTDADVQTYRASIPSQIGNLLTQIADLQGQLGKDYSTEVLSRYNTYGTYGGTLYNAQASQINSQVATLKSQIQTIGQKANEFVCN